MLSETHANYSENWYTPKPWIDWVFETMRRVSDVCPRGWKDGDEDSLTSENRWRGKGGPSLLLTLFVVFLVLKLTDNIDWSWWWVCSPLWVPIAIISIAVVIGWMFDVVGL